MIYTVSSKPKNLPTNVWLCEAYIPLGLNPRFTAYSPSLKKWGNGHSDKGKVKYTLDAPCFPVYTNEQYDYHWASSDEYYIDLDGKFICHGLTQIPWTDFLNYLFSFGIHVTMTQLADYFSKPFILVDKVYLWNAKIKASTPAAEQEADLEIINYNTFYTQTTGNVVGLSDQEVAGQAQGSAQAVESIYEEMKKQAFSFDTLLKVKKPHINPYKWVLSGGKVTYTPTEQVATDGKPEF